MGSDRSAFGAALPLGKPRLSLGDLGLLALLLLVFVGIAPFEVRDANALLHGADESGAGNLARQLSYLAVFAAAGIAAALAGVIVSENADGSLGHFDRLGDVIVVSTLITMGMMTLINRYLSQTNKDVRKEETHAVAASEA